MVTPTSKNLPFLPSAPLAIAFVLICGCKQVSLTPVNRASFHDKFGWQAENFFDDPQVVLLCKAIESEDIAEMERLIKNGANVNAIGRGNMTPLMWAFPDNKLERFKALLKHGADPNIKFMTDFGVPSAFKVGDSITSCAAESWFPGYFEAVMEAGGDPNITDGHGSTLIHVIILATLPDAKERCRLAVIRGADVNQHYAGMTPAIAAASTFGQYDLTLFLLEQGANHNAYMSDELQKLIHIMVRNESELPRLQPEQRAAYQRVMDWLHARGQDSVEARQDVQRWAKIPPIPKEFSRRTKVEIEARKKREQEEQSRADAKSQE